MTVEVAASKDPAEVASAFKDGTEPTAKACKTFARVRFITSELEDQQEEGAGRDLLMPALQQIVWGEYAFRKRTRG